MFGVLCVDKLYYIDIFPAFWQGEDSDFFEKINPHENLFVFMWVLIQN